MKLLLLGGSGQVGSEVRDLCEGEGHACIAPSSSDLDITNKESVASIIKKNLPLDFIVNASAYTAVDKAEDEVEIAYKINRDGPRYLAEACAQHNIPLLHISTDYVFDGHASMPYKEGDPTSPLGVYGQSKREGELAVRNSLKEHIILRTAWVYGAHGNNFVKTMLRLGQTRSELRVVSDQFGCPSAALDIAKTIIAMIEQLVSEANDRWGTYHYCSRNSTDWADFARAIFTEAKTVVPDFPDIMVHSIASSDYPTKAKRPNYSILDCMKIKQMFTIPLPIWQESLKRDIPNILKNI